jgi:hypothetical protein
MIRRFAITLHKSAKFSLKAECNPEGVRIFLVVGLFVCCHLPSVAQVERPVNPPVDPLPIVQDTSKLPSSLPVLTDSASLSADSLATQKKSDIETTINYSATDSIVSSLDGRKIWLYGDAKITYGIIELAADEILIDYANNTLAANGTRDSLGRRIGFPVFKNGAEVYETKDIVYNFKTKRAKISEVVTKQGDGIIHGESVFKNEKNELLTKNNLYTTCALEHPHFAIHSTKVKAIPNDKIISGPFYMEFNGVPIYPMGFLFGIFPAERESKSGIIFPAYGEERNRGFNIRDGGYFFDINENVKLTLLGSLYSKGGHALSVISPYDKRYAYRGSLTFGYTKTPTNTRIENKAFQNDYQLSWSHSPQSKGTGRFSASVNAATSTYNQNNNLYNNNLSSTSQLNNTTRRLQSNISYSKTFRKLPLSIGINASHNQDLVTKLINIKLPSFSANVNNLYPFQRKDAIKQSPLDNLNLRYTMTAENSITNRLGIPGSDGVTDSIAPFTTGNLSSFFENGIRGMRHVIPISTSAKVFQYFTLSPSLNYTEVWYGQKLMWGYNELGAIVKTDTLQGFDRVGTYSGGASMNTRIYGTYNFKRGKVKAIRHVINPSVSYSYSPDFSGNRSYFQKFTDENGKVIYKSRHEGFIYGGAQLGQNQSLGFSLGNNLEMKVKSEDDTVARKVSLLNQFSISSSYNLLADSFKLAPFSLSANTNVLNGKLSINASAVYDPYRILDGRKVSQYVWEHGLKGRITNANMALSTNFNPQGQKNDTEQKDKINNSTLSEADKQHMLNNPNEYVDFTIPWNLRLSYSLNYSNNILVPDEITQTLQFSGDLSLSEQWKINFNSNFDFQAKKLTQTNLKILRDLHCWTMALDWTPFGYFTSYNFRINVKSSVLQDLKMERRKPFLDNNF